MENHSITAHEVLVDKYSKIYFDIDLHLTAQ